VCRAAEEAVKHAILADQAQIQPADLRQALDERRAIAARLGQAVPLSEHGRPGR
jgi:hypothetical protein